MAGAAASPLTSMRLHPRERAAVEQPCCGPRVRAIDEAGRSGAPVPLFFSARHRATAGGGDRRCEDLLGPTGPFIL